MDSPGDRYAVIVNDPALRAAMVREARRPRAQHTSRNSRWLRRWMARALHRLAARIEPSPAVAMDVSPATT